MPTDFVEFLDFHKYDIIFILRNLAALFATYGENYLARSKHYTFSVLEIYSISERLKLPTPPTEVCDNKYDFSHILDFANMIEGITILPIQNTLAGMNYDEYTEQFDRQMRLAVHKPIGTSSLIPDELKFDLTAFKNIKMLKIYGISTENIIEGTSLRETIEKLYVQKTNITDIKQIVLCDAPVHKIMESESDQERAWKKVKYANFSDNQVTAIDKSINLLPKVTELILDRNCIEKIVYFRSLPLLSSLSLESNRIKDCHDLHMQLGNLVTLNVSQNQIKSLKGFQKLYSLVTLDISCNLIDTVDEVDHIGRLPCLENLSLTGNPVAGSVDYRSRVLSRFGDRLNEIHLDNEKGSGKELDTALALSALRISMSRNSSFTESNKNVFCTISKR